MEIKLLHTSDLHIDWLFDNFSSSAKAIRRKELIKSLDIITDIAIQKQVDALLISGDLFHAPQVDRSSLTAVLANFQRLAEQNIYIMLLPGNHDPIVNNGWYDFIDLPENVHVFKEKQWTFFDKIPNLKIYGYPYAEEQKNKNVLSELQVSKNSGFNIALLHGSYKDVSLIENYMPFSDEDIENSNLDYIALGHYHNFRDCSKCRVKCIYPGSPNSLSFNNTGDRQVVLTRLSFKGIEVKPIIIPGRRYVQFEYDMTLGNPIDLFRKIEEHNDPATCFKIVLTGLIDQTKLVEVNEVEKLFSDKFFYFELVDRTIIMNDDTNDTSVKGIFLNKMNEKLNDLMLSEEEREILENALRIGYFALERGRI